MISRRQVVTLGQWLALGSLVGAIAGVASAAFLYLLDLATHTRERVHWIVFTLPVAGLVIGAIYERYGASIRGGNNLVIETVQDAKPQIPLRMAPMVLIGTVLTHLFGGSAGREGTAVQMAASLADEVAHRFKLAPHARRQLLAAGIAGGFGSVFGTPIAGAFFGLEVIRVGRVDYDALLPALIASVVGDLVTRGLGIVHTAYPRVESAALTPSLAGRWCLFALVIALVTSAFVELLHLVKKRGEKHIPNLPVRMFIGGVVVVALWQASRTDDYLGLGVPTIVRAFSDAHLAWSAFAWKLVMTAVTVGSGFLGGEVTPLFFVGATLGNDLARLLQLPLGLAVGIGLATVFGTAANTPIALSIMAVELLGGGVLPHVVIVAVIAYLASGHRGIYPSQKIAHGKLDHRGLEP
jgi:H+/Cl- antiporter ClcA